MKSSIVKSVSLLIILASLTTSCSHDRDKIEGKWRIARMEIQYYKQQKEQAARQMKMLEDSIAANMNDTAKYPRFQMQLNSLKEREHMQQVQQDTAMATNRWNFKENGDFEAIEVASKVNAHKTYFTHMSHQMGLHDVISSELPESFFLAYDGLILGE